MVWSMEEADTSTNRCLHIKGITTMESKMEKGLSLTQTELYPTKDNFMKDFLTEKEQLSWEISPEKLDLSMDCPNNANNF